jgi:predicted  nucleic acid-binding Zn-ribbon protein
LLIQHKKDGEERSRLETDNATFLEDKKKLVATLQTAKQRLVTLRSEKEQLESTCSELRKQIEAGPASALQKTAGKSDFLFNVHIPG